jgi:hypothetical protein
MAMPNFDYQGALDAGYSEDEIKDFLTQHQHQQPQYKKTNQPGKFLENITNNASNFFGNLGNPTGRQEKEPSPLDRIDQKLLKNTPNFDVNAAIEAGYSPDEINDFLEENKPKKSKLEKGARIAGQYAIGIAENAFLPYELGAARLGSKDAQKVAYRQHLMENIEDLQQLKELSPNEWKPQDQTLLDDLVEQMKNPTKSEEFVQAHDIGVRGLAGKITGQDLHPEGILEKAAGWTGFLKNRKNLYKFGKDLATLNLTPKDILKGVLPGSDAMRGLTTGTALQMAEEGQFGPLGTLGAVIAGDVIGHGPKAIFYVLRNPKAAAAKAVNLVTMNNTKREAAKQLIEDFNKAGLQIDLGTLTGSPVVQMVQARLSQSGLTGSALDNFRKELSGQITREYQLIMDNLGEMAFENSHQAQEAIKDAMRVQEFELGIPKISKEEPSKGSRSLQGRVGAWEHPEYEQNLLSRISPTEFESDYIAGETLKTAAEDIKNPIKEQFEHRWTAFNNEIQGISTPQPELANDMRNFVREHQGSLLLGESAPEARVLQAAQNLLQNIEHEGAYIGVNLNNLVKTKRTLGDIANWEFGGSNFESAYKKLVGDIDRAIDRTLQSVSPELRQQFEMLNAEYSQFKDVFENKNVRPLFEPKNQNYNAIYNSFVSNPDKLRSLEDMLYISPRGKELGNQIKRDYAAKQLSKQNLSDRDLRNLRNALGPDFENVMNQFEHDRRFALQHPLPQLAPRRPLGIEAQMADLSKTAPPIGNKAKLTGVSGATEGAKRRTYEYISKQSPEQMMKKMDTIKGIREMKAMLSVTPEGKKLFGELSRFKMAEMIDRKMQDSISGNIKLGKFSHLLETSKEKAIVQELLGKKSFERLNALQKNSGKIAQSAEKFYNASKSGTTVGDMALVGTTLTGLLTLNPFMFLTGVSYLGGSYVTAKLLADPKFIKELQNAILSSNSKQMIEHLHKMRPYVNKAMLETSRSKALDLQEKPI